MKIVRFILTACVLLVGASLAFAQGSDPKITSGGGGSCNSFDITSLTEEFTITTIGCAVDFTNDTDTPIGVEVVNVDPADFSGTLSCATDGGPLDGTSTTYADACMFTAPPGSTGLTPGSLFSLTFTNDTSGSWASSVEIILAPTVLPEPATILLLGVGLVVVLLVGRKSAGLRGQAVSRAS